MQMYHDELTRLNEILSEYISIHNSIFKFSWRKLIPIPLLFKPINFGDYFSILDKQAIELTIMKISFEKIAALAVAAEYTQSLLKTIQRLRDICGRLFEESQGHTGSYSMSEYNIDCNNYNASVKKHQALGLILNQHINTN